ncbi:MAG: hypothetical protein J0L86_00390 [Flavobacteriales bacterium]|nr:hypothetical protein [Flavobacteriales bacterium]
MKTPFFNLAFLLVSGFVFSQTTITTSKPIPQNEWEAFVSKYQSVVYGDVRVTNTKGVTAQILGDKPVNPMDVVSWRPPVIPPLKNAEFVGKPKIPVKQNPKYSVVNVRPKPINPNCETCSTIVIASTVSKEELAEIQKFFSQYN